MKRKVDVSLLGHRFTVRTEKDEAYVHGLAAQVARRLEDAQRKMRHASLTEQVLLVALTLADELSEQCERAATTRAEVRQHTEAVIGKLSAALGERDMDRTVDEESDEIALAAVHREA